MPEQNPLNPSVTIQPTPPSVGGSVQIPAKILEQVPVQSFSPVSTGSVPLRTPMPLVKQGSQLSFRGLFIGCGVFLLLVLLLGGGAVYYLMNNPELLGQGASANPLSSFIIQGQKRTPYTNQILIAPVLMNYNLNMLTLQAQLGQSIPVSTIYSIILDCGNKQFIPLGTDGFFEKGCFYTAKQSYPVTLLIVYPDPQTKTMTTGQFTIGSLDVSSLLSIDTTVGKPILNDSKNEFVVSKPTRVFFDASKIVTDLGLSSNDIDRDFDGDGKIDVSGTTKPSFVYKTSALYTVMYSIATRSQIFSFPLRIQESTDIQCSINETDNKDNQLTRKIEGNPSGKDYRREIIDATTNTIKQTIKRSIPSVSASLLPGDYRVNVAFLTEEGRQSTCETDVFKVQDNDLGADIQIRYKTPTINEFISPKTGSIVSWSGDGLTIGSLPTYLILEIASIKPSIQDVDIQLLFNNKRIIQTRPGVYEITITESVAQKINITLTHKNTSATRTYSIPLVSTQAKVIGNLTIMPDTAGSDPFEVTLDVSKLTLTDKDDEIVTFTRDFGDGEVSKNVNQGTVNHVYKYNTLEDDGEYRPSVTIKTKKGISQKLEAINPIIVKRTTRNISIKTDSHPSQIASVGDRIQLRIESNGSIKSIVRDYGDGRQTQECEGRSCIDTTVIYNDPGNYNVKATITYADHPAVSNSLRIKIE